MINFLLGALPYLFGKCGLSCPVYATIPVFQMGQMFAYDLYQSRNNYEEFDLFTLDDVDLAFEKVIQVKYNQTITLKDKGQGLTLTPLPAGHMLGGTIWRIVKDAGEEIIYATDYNHKNERHLTGCDRVFTKFSRPSLLITDFINVEYTPSKRKDRDERLQRNIYETVRQGGNVLISLDSAGRALELAHLLEQMWRDSKGALQAYSLVMLNNFSYNVIEFAKSLVEWMSEKLMRQFEGQRNNPFAFRHIQLCHNLAELSRVSEPAVILASQPDLECGFSREIFFTLAQNPKNTIILTQRSSPGSLADILQNLPDDEKERTIEVEKKSRVPLTGKELEDFLEARRQEALEREREELERQKAVQIKEEDESEESDEEDFFDEETQQQSPLKMPQESRTSMRSESDDKATPIGLESKIKHDLMMSSRIDGRVKGGGFFKNAKKSYPMFPSVERKIKWDEYGEIINPDDFSIFDMSRIMGSGEDKENMDDPMGNGNDQLGSTESKRENLNPTKCLSSMVEVNVACRIEFIDFEGRSDADSIKRIIGNVKPRRLILVRGLAEAISTFQSYLVSNGYMTSDRIFTPKALDLVDATTERHIYQVKLRDALVSSLRLSAPGKDGAQLAWVEAEIAMTNATESLMPAYEEEGEADIKMETSDASNAVVVPSPPPESIIIGHQQRNNANAIKLMPTLQQMPQSRLPPHSTIFVNELKLSDFKQILMKAGVQAEFQGGVLLCNGTVEVKRTEAGHIHLEGTVCDDYFKVRKLLYDQYAIL